ncbi:hypothetical protein SAMN05518801_12060 [Novosphingobium sp. CF614]|uniref:hypothetical protein n=1 Tax=Novosphingobium sp. CF614 TaxID=1884364 RepID=UPI0008E90242|nr:hypothetical protein [Novosphingobium sp. CF614]SFG37669.1 hypothetical protein SAMN05518801_12060 [Novosphingobium sp. CF614]
MRIRLLAVSLIVAAVPLGSASAQIFDTDFGAMVLNQNIGAINTYNTQVDRIDSERRADESRRNGRQSAPVPNAPIPATTMALLKNAVVDVLDPEYRRRLAAYGQTSSKSWASTTLKSVGGQVGALTPEYQRRVRSSGQKAADNWLVSRTRQIAGSYVSIGARTPAPASGVVPASTMKKAEDAAFAVLNPEINRRAGAYGKAAAESWSRSAGQTVGADVGRLKPEYLRRAKEDGQARADEWIVAQSRAIASRYVESQR